MSDVIIPDVTASDVLEGVENIVEENVNYAEKNLAELVGLFEELVRDEDRLKKSKEAEAIKAAFYKRLLKEKAEAGMAVAEAVETEVEETEEVVESTEETVSDNPFVEIEKGFKELYNKYKTSGKDNAIKIIMNALKNNLLRTRPYNIRKSQK